MPISDLLAQITGETQPSISLLRPAEKRKADGDLQGTTGKLIKKDQPIVTTMTQIKRTANPSTPAIQLKSSTSASSNSGIGASSSNGTSAATVSAADPTRPPKKGSYAEIIARGKAAQATRGNVGKIQHKAIEKGLSKRERQELKEKQSQSNRVSKRPSGSSTRDARNRNGAREKGVKVSSKVKTPIVPEKKIKKAALATTGYTGTARPNPAAIKSSKSISSSRAAEKTGYRLSSSDRPDTYASEEDEDEEMEEEGDYYSDASSDMEADVFEVDEEEEKAARIARKEDEKALREEARHQREKEEKRSRLADLAKAKH